MLRLKQFLLLSSVAMLSGCGTLESKTILLNFGDTKEKVLATLGVPQDRQLQGNKEAWQYCVSGAGFGYNDHKIVWFTAGQVTGINTYRTNVSGCTAGIKTVRWESAPDAVIEVRQR